MNVISVVCNFNMYNRLVKQNPCFGKNVKFIVWDNNKENKPISIRYNEFLNDYDYSNEDWFVFCHEDWELKEKIDSKIESLDKSNIYGPIGMEIGKWWKAPVCRGRILQSNKDGSNVVQIGEKSNEITEVGTFDCQCIIVHSSLIKKYDLRFDETLSFDLYVEDFCIQAREKYGIVSKILPLKCQHYSYGNVSKRFYELLKYMRKKYKKSNRIYYSTVEGELISCPFPRLACYFLPRLRNVLHFFYQSKFTKQNKRLIKICKIPVYIKGEKE